MPDRIDRTGSTSATASPRAASPPAPGTSTVVRPADRAPTISDSCPRGNPPPSAASSDGTPSRGAILAALLPQRRVVSVTIELAITQQRFEMGEGSHGRSTVSLYLRQRREYKRPAIDGIKRHLSHPCKCRKERMLRSDSVSTPLETKAPPLDASPAPFAPRFCTARSPPSPTATSRSSGSAPSPRRSAPGCSRSRRAGWSSTSRKSSFYLGLDYFFGQLPILLFTVIGGVIADRHDRRQLLLGSQYVQMATAFTLAVARLLDHVHVVADPGAVVRRRLGAGVRRSGLPVADSVARAQEGSAERDRAQLDPVQPRARVRPAARRHDDGRVRQRRRASG